MAYAPLPTEAFTDLYASDSLFARLRARSAGLWQSHVGHRFVHALADGSLPPATFLTYLAQDHLYIVQFARAHALAAVRADTLDAMRLGINSARALLEEESKMQEEMAERMAEIRGSTDSASSASVGEAGSTGGDGGSGHVDDDAGDGWRPGAMHPTTLAYTSFQLERGMSGDLLDLRIAMTPCAVGYAEIGRSIAHALDPMGGGAGFDPASHPYGQWIAAYAGESYQAVARRNVVEMERLWATRGGEARFAALGAVFDQATRFEVAFWDMGLE
jgi:thiaminase/transcriptional activator TenA